MIRSTRNLSLFLFLIVLAGFSAAYLQGVSAVPFHPDESTYLFTSGDVETFWKQPSNIYWREENEGDPRQHYRKLDAPLHRNLIALGRLTVGLPPLPVDWAWDKSWEENRRAGALPSPELLLAGRMAIAALFPFSVLFLFLAVRRTANDFTAWTAALLLASNALVLLHTRRAMAEGPLLVTTTFMMWALVRTEKRPWLAALPAALAFCAKQSLAALLPVGLLAVLWQPGKLQVKRTVGQLALFSVITVAVIVPLHPFVWDQPVPALQAALRTRQELMSKQTSDRPEQALDTPGKRIIGLVGSVYLTPPIFAEVGNYRAETKAAEDAYLANPLHSLWRGMTAGGILLVISLFGFVLAALQVFRAPGPARRRLALLLLATVLQTLALLALVPLAWQRYYLPVVPFACLWTAFGLDRLRSLFVRAARPVKTAAPALTPDR